MTFSPLTAYPALLPPAPAPAGSAGHERNAGPRGAEPRASAAPSSASEASPHEEQSSEPQDALAAAQAERAASPDGLTAKERRIVAELQRIDRQVRAHEQAHLAAAAGLARGVSYQFATGPDGRRYAVGGEVRIDTAPVKGDAAATVRKAQQIRAAANAPANPSAQDRAVAAQLPPWKLKRARSFSPSGATPSSSGFARRKRNRSVRTASAWEACSM